MVCNIAVLITCHNRKEKTLNCLTHLFSSSLPSNYKISTFLVNDGSTDGTGDAVKQQFPQVTLITGNGNLFWNRGMNLAWSTAINGGDYNFYLWLNDDVTLFDNSISTLLNDYHNLNNRKIIIAGTCRSTNGEVTYTGYNNLSKKIKLIPNGHPQPCDYFNGNIVLIPHIVFRAIGFLDSTFHHGQGDFDYGLRAGKVGIISYISSQYIGICERNKEFPIWCNKNYSLHERIENFKSPLGGRPKSTFLFQKRHIGITVAIFHYITIHLRLFFPGIWNLKKQLT